MTTQERMALATLAGTVAGVHELLAPYGDELDGARCSLEDAYSVMVEALFGIPSAEALAQVL